QTGGAFGLRRTTTTDASGAFLLSGLWPVSGVVVARTREGREARSETIELTPNQPRTVQLRLEVGWRIEGTVRGIAGALETARVLLHGEHAMDREGLTYTELAKP